MKQNKLKFSTLKRAVIGGSAVPAGDDPRASRTTTACEVLHAWGMTEMSPLGTVCTLKAKQPRCRREQRYALQSKQGRAIFGVDMKIVDDEGKELPRDGKAFGDLHGARAVDASAATSRARAAIRCATAGSRPATSRPSTPTATCRSPTARRT